MARMIPREVGPATESNAERRLFQRIRDELDSDWTALHSLGLTRHERKPWAEIDFVLIGPSGVFCLEVKGGRIGRQDRQWFSIGGDDRRHLLNGSPFEQAGSAAAALFQYLRTRVRSIESSVLGYGVAMPDIVFNLEGPDLARELVYDESDLFAPFVAYVDGLAIYWRGRVATSREYRLLSVEARRAVVEALAADFDLRPTLRAQVNQAEEELVRLTTDQCRVLDSVSDNPRILVRGGAGTGKTMLALETARLLANSGRNVLLTCFNRNLAVYLKAQTVANPSILVRHLHGFLADIVDESEWRHRLPAAQSTDLFEVFYPDLALEAILTDRYRRRFDALVVDEAQDILANAYLDVFDAVLREGLRGAPWRVFLDPNQDVFTGTSPQALQRLLSEHPVQLRLPLNCRNTRPIGTATALLCGLPVAETLVAEGPEVHLHWYVHRDQERHLIGECIRKFCNQGVTLDRIVILSPSRLAKSCLATGLPGSRLAVVDVGERNDPLQAGQVKFSTVHSFKGLESECVLLVDIDDLHSRDGLAAVYVGASRARALLAVFLAEEARAAYHERAFEMGRRLVEQPPSSSA